MHSTVQARGVAGVGALSVAHMNVWHVCRSCLAVVVVVVVVVADGYGNGGYVRCRLLQAAAFAPNGVAFALAFTFSVKCRVCCCCCLSCVVLCCLCVYIAIVVVFLFSFLLCLSNCTWQLVSISLIQFTSQSLSPSPSTLFMKPSRACPPDSSFMKFDSILAFNYPKLRKYDLFQLCGKLSLITAHTPTSIRGPHLYTLTSISLDSYCRWHFSFEMGIICTSERCLSLWVEMLRVRDRDRGRGREKERGVREKEIYREIVRDTLRERLIKWEREREKRREKREWWESDRDGKRKKEKISRECKEEKQTRNKKSTIASLRDSQSKY